MRHAHQVAAIADDMLNVSGQRKDFRPKPMTGNVVACVSPSLIGIRNTPKRQIHKLGRRLRAVVNANPIDFENVAIPYDVALREPKL